MCELDPPWADYLQIQGRICQRGRMDAIGWGLEAGLDHILAQQQDQGQQSFGTANAAIERGKSRERYRAHLRDWYFDSRKVNEPTAQLHDRIYLADLLTKITAKDRAILLATGFGYDSAAVASIFSTTPSAVRQRIVRLRSRLVHEEGLALSPSETPEAMHKPRDQ